ncbi:hypothetical protein D3C87_1879850 [compost metagenome]
MVGHAQQMRGGHRHLCGLVGRLEQYLMLVFGGQVENAYEEVVVILLREPIGHQLANADDSHNVT